MAEVLAPPVDAGRDDARPPSARSPSARPPEDMAGIKIPDVAPASRAGIAAEEKKYAPPPGRQSIISWFFNSWRDGLHLDAVEGGRAFRALTDSLSLSVLPFSGALRHQMFHVLKFGRPLNSKGYLAGVFKAWTGPDIETIYASAFWRQGDPSPVPEYVLVTPSFVSCDGEYRGGLVLWDQFEEGYRTLQETFSDFEGRIIGMLGRGELGLDSYIISPAGKRRDAAQQSIKALRLCIRLMAVAWYWHIVYIGTMAAADLHVSPYHLEVFAKISADSWPRGGYPSVSQEAMNVMTIFTTGKANALNRLKCGLKAIPLTLRSASVLDDVNYYPWREVYAGELCSDAVINGLVPGLPIFGAWTFVGGAGPTLFENDAMVDAYVRGELAKQSVAMLKRARLGKDEGFPEKFPGLDTRIMGAIQYAQSMNLMSDVAMFTTWEDVGYTFGSWPPHIRAGKYAYHPSISRAFSDLDRFKRYVFDLVYALHVLHTRLSLIHGDPHVNNFTIYILGPTWRLRAGSAGPGESADMYVEVVNDPIVAYVVGPDAHEKDTYIFPHEGLFATIIDFSRATLGPRARGALELRHGRPYAEAFFRDQTSRILRVLDHYIPNTAKRDQENIKGFALRSPEAFFRVMSAVDFLGVGRNLKLFLTAEAERDAHLTDDDVRPLGVNPDAIAFAAQLEELGLELLIGGLSGGEGAGGPPPFASEVIIPRLFGEYQFARWEPERLRAATLVDAYNGTNPIRYSGSDYEKYPPWARVDTIASHLEGLKMTDVIDRGTEAFLDSLSPSAHIEVLMAQVRESIEDGVVADLSTAAAGSSWLYDV